MSEMIAGKLIKAVCWLAAGMSICLFLGCERASLCLRYYKTTHHQDFSKGLAVEPREIALEPEWSGEKQAFDVGYATFLLPRVADTVTSVSPGGFVTIQNERFFLGMSPPSQTGKPLPKSTRIAKAEREKLEEIFKKTGALDSYEHLAAVAREKPQPIFKIMFLPKAELRSRLALALEKGMMGFNGYDLYKAPHSQGVILLREKSDTVNPVSWSTEQPVHQGIFYKSKRKDDLGPLHLMLTTLEYKPEAEKRRDGKMKAVESSDASRLKPRPIH